MSEVEAASSTLPAATVIIPAFNAAETIATQLEALCRQDFEDAWELIVADNGSEDNTVQIASRLLTDMPTAYVVDASGRRGPSFARNVAARRARGCMLAFCDADDIVDRSWLRELISASHAAAVVVGHLDLNRLNDPHVRSWQPDLSGSVQRHLGHLLAGSSANMAVSKALFASLGGFNERYLAAEDVELCWRAQLAGAEIVAAPAAVVHYRLRSASRDLARQSFTYGQADRRLISDFALRDPVHKRVRAWAGLAARLPGALADHRRRGCWLRDVSYRLGRR